MFYYHRSKYLYLTDTNNINLNTNDNLLNDNSNYNRNSNVDVTNSDSNEDSNRNLDSSNNFISIMTRGSNSNSDELSSNWRGVYYFLLGGESMLKMQ